MLPRKAIFFVSLILLLVVVDSEAYTTPTVWWKETVLEGIWNDPNNWYMNTPDSNSIVNINKGGRITIIDANHAGPDAAVCTDLYIPDYQQEETAPCYLNMTGGTFAVSNNIEMGLWSITGDIGELDISGGTITIGGELHVGARNVWASVGGEGIINMTGGTIDVTSTLRVPVTSTTGGTIYLDGGTIEAGGISMDANGLIDITAGTLIIDGNVTSTINNYVTSGYITAYGGDGTVDIYYDTGTNTTSLSVLNPAYSHYPNPTGIVKITEAKPLSWTPGLYAADVDGQGIYLGTNFDDVNNATTSDSTGIYRGTQDTSEYTPPETFELGNTYYWRVDQINDTGPPPGPNTWKGEVWKFTVDSGKAGELEPPNGATGIGLEPTLRWVTGCYADDTNGHDVYFGTDFASVNNATTSDSTGIYRSRQDSNEYSPPEALELERSYYWRIDQINEASFDVKGDIWQFKTTDFILIDDFESYADGNTLRLVWIDGTDGNNNTGSLVFLDTDIYHNSIKSMECDYNNNDAPYYSEVYQTYDTAQDWTTNNIKFLSLFFHGDIDNDPEQMYVVLGDDNDVNAIVTYDGDANNLIQEEAEYWNVWNIRLSDFNSSGVNLGYVKKITIGLGGSGGAGIAFFDDIRLRRFMQAADDDYIPKADFNGDLAVNLLDFAELANAWLSEDGQPQFDLVCNLYGDDTIDISDLEIFTQDWLWPHHQVNITIDACDVKGDISTMLTGVNMNFDDDEDGLWAGGDIAGYLIDVKAGILRYPGGAKTGHYHWQYPQVPKYTDAWNPAVNPDTYPPSNMDIDEYITWCNFIGAEPLVGINIQSGLREWGTIPQSVNEAVDFVTYCNITNDYNVVYWYLDNEMYYGHNAGAIDVVEYTDYVNQFGAAMRAVDANIKFVVNWQTQLNEPNYWAEWEYLIEEANEYVNVADMHWYWAWGYNSWDLWLADNPMVVREYCESCPPLQRYIGPSYSDEIAQFHQKIQDVNGVSYDIKLAALEWNLGKNNSFSFSRFQDALIHAEMIGQYIEGGLDMAAMWPLSWVGDIGDNFRAIIDQENHKPTPSFYVFKLYSNVLGQQLITSQTSQVYIRPVSALSQDGYTLWVFLINKSSDGQAVKAVLDIAGFALAETEAISLTAPDVSSDVGWLQKLRVAINSETGKWESVLPPYSLTMLTLRK